MYACFYILYNILLCVSRPRRKRFFGHVHVCAVAFSPVAENVHRARGSIYICMYTIFCVVCGQKITPTVIYCRRDTYYSLLQADRVRGGGGGLAGLGALSSVPCAHISTV